MVSTIPQKWREIEFEDIREGDDVEVVWVWGDRTDTVRGIADHMDANGWWVTPRGQMLTLAGDGIPCTILLHGRPAAAEPTKLGAVVRARVATSNYDTKSVRTLVRTAVPDGPWADERECFWHWSDLDPNSIEVLPEGIEVES